MNTHETPVVAAYLSARLSEDQTIDNGTWGGRTVVMKSIEGQGIPYDNTSGIFTLEAGKLYRITAQLGWRHVKSNLDFDSRCLPFAVVNVGSGGEVCHRAEAIGASKLYPGVTHASSGFLNVVYAPTWTRDYCLMVRNSEKKDDNVFLGTNFVIRADTSTYLNIVELSGGDIQSPPLEYLSAKRFTPQTIPSGETWANKIVNILHHVPEVTCHGISFSPEGYFELKGGVPYHITAQLGWQASSQGWYAFGLFDSKGTQIGPWAESLSAGLNSPNASGGVLDVIYTPTSNEWCYLGMSPDVKAGASSKIRADVSTFLNIVALTAGRTQKYVAAGIGEDKSIPDAEKWANRDIVMDNIVAEKDTMYDQKTGQFYLSSESTYRITAQMSWTPKERNHTRNIGGIPVDYYVFTRTYYAFGLFDSDGKQYGPLAEVVSRGATTCNASGGVFDLIFTPPASGWYRLKTSNMTATGGDSTLRAASSYVIILTL
jgi:hypothetical protein